MTHSPERPASDRLAPDDGPDHDSSDDAPDDFAGNSAGHVSGRRPGRRPAPNPNPHPDPVPTDDVLAGVGPHLRALRRARGTTLAALAAETGLTASTLSRLENGRLRPTLEQLLPLARAHGVPLDDLVAAPPTGDPRIHMRPVKRSGLVMVPLTRRPGGIQSYKVIYPPAGRAPTTKLQTHEGYEWFYVLDGHIRFILGEEEFRLGPGEAAEFDTRVPHWIGSAEPRTAEVLALFGPQGERAHLAPTDR